MPTLSKNVLLTTLLLLWTLTLHATTSPGPPIPTLTLPPDSLTNHPTESISGNPELDAEIRAELTRMLGHDPLATNVAPRDMPITLTVDAEGARDNVEGIANLTGDALVKLKQAKGWLQQLELEGNFVTDLRNQEKKLPLGIRKNIGGVTLTLAIGEVRLLPEGTEVDVVMSIEIPGVPDKLILGASDVGFSFSGGFTGQLTLELLGNYGINIAKGKSRLVFFTGNPERRTGTYAKVTCAGFEELNIQASLIMSRDWVKPFRGGELMTNEAITGIVERQGATGQVVPPDAAMNLQKLYRVHWDFEFNLAGEDGFYIQTGSKDTFAINGYNDFSIYADDITLDFSDVQNPGNVFPDNYNSPYVTNGDASPLWRGVYIGSIQIGLPADWRGGDKPPIEIFGRSIIIDDMGFTGMVGVNNLIPLKEGSVDSWAFSLDTFRLEIMQNQIQRVGMAGLINVPLLKADSTAGVNNSDTLRRVDCLSYLAVVQPGSFYQFVATTNSSYTIDIWKSSLTLRPGCSVEILSDAGNLSASATLFGDIKIDASIGDGEKFGLKADGIGFDSLVVSTSDGFEKLGKWTFPREVSGQLGPFGITFSDISLTKKAATKEAFLKFASMVDIEGENTHLAAGGAFELQGTYATEDDGKQKYKFTEFKVSALRVAMTTSSFGVDVTVALYKKHAVFGNGFYGKGSFYLKAAGGKEAGIAAVAQFGHVVPEDGEKFSYFFLDGMFKFPTPGPVIGPFELLAIGGGVYINMEKQVDPPGGQTSYTPRQDLSGDLNDATSRTLADVEASMAQGPDNLSSFIGFSLSGQKFLPKKDTFGGKIAVVVALPGPAQQTLSINAAIELNINGANGWNMSINGNGTFFNDVNYENNPSDEGLAAFFEISYVKDVDGTRFLAALDFFVGFPPLKGYTGGNSEFMDDNPWLADDETPTVPGAFNERMYPLTQSSYAGGIYFKADGDGLSFNIGNPVLGLQVDIPVIGVIQAIAYFHLGNNVTPMPPLPRYVADFAGGESNFLRNESLFASGRGIAFGARLDIKIEPRIPLFKVRVGASLGFDVNFQKYPGAICLETGEGLGINNWYGAGQAWAFLDGYIGLEFRIPLRGKIEFEIASIALGAILQAKGPNPIYATGAIGGRFSILNGFIRGDFRMQFKAGTECNLVAANGGDVLSNVQLVSVVLPRDDAENVATDSKIQVLTNFPILVDSIDLNENIYRLDVSEFSMYGPDGIIASVTVRTVGDYEITVIPFDMLESNTTYRLEGNLSLVEVDTDNNVNDTTINISFTTGEGYDTIPASNIALSYPMSGMYNLYEDESTTGYIELKQGQPGIFEDELTAYFIAPGGAAVSAPITYNEGRKRANFTFPDLSSETIYHLIVGRTGQFIGSPGNGNDDPGGSGNGGPAEPIIPLGNFSTTLPGDTLVSLYFRTSEFATFTAKINNQLKDKDFPNPELIYTLAEGETLDAYELQGSDVISPLVKVEALKNSDWYSDYKFDQKMYSKFPFVFQNTTIDVAWRDKEEGEVEQPLKYVYFSKDNTSPLINRDHWEAGGVDSPGNAYTFNFLFPDYVFQDARDIENQLLTVAGDRMDQISMNYTNKKVAEALSTPSIWGQYQMRGLRHAYCDSNITGECVRPQPLYCPYATGGYYAEPTYVVVGNAQPPKQVLDEVAWTREGAVRLAFANCVGNLGNNSGENCDWCPMAYSSPFLTEVQEWMQVFMKWETSNNRSPLDENLSDPHRGYSFPIKFKYYLPGEEFESSSVTINMNRPD